MLHTAPVGHLGRGRTIGTWALTQQFGFLLTSYPNLQYRKLSISYIRTILDIISYQASYLVSTLPYNFELWHVKHTFLQYCIQMLFNQLFFYTTDQWFSASKAKKFTFLSTTFVHTAINYHEVLYTLLHNKVLHSHLVLWSK